MNLLFLSGLVTLLPLLGHIPASAAASDAVRPDTLPPALAPLGAEHAELRAAFTAALNRAAAPGATRADRDGLISFLRSNLIPHAQVEERVLYPALETALDTRGFATATLILDHQAVARMTLELAALSDADPASFRSKALTLAGVVERHFANEEGFVFPSLAGKLGSRALRALLVRMDEERIVPRTPR